MLIAFSFVFAIPGHADFGDFGGDSDYGYDGGGYDYDSGNDYDYDYGNDDDDYDNDYDNGGFYFGGFGSGYDTGGSGGSTGGSSEFREEGNDTFAIIVGIILIAIIVFFVLKKAGIIGGKHNSGPIMPGAQRTDRSTLSPISDYTQLDPGFSDSEFKEKLANMYVQFQNAWQEKNMESLRPYLTDAFYAQCDRQLDNYRQNHQTNKIERISVLGVDLDGWKQENGLDIMIATVRTRIVDYVVDDNTGNIVRGSNTAEKFMTYEWTVERTSGQTTESIDGTKVQSCPHCGATININHTAVCEYCGSVLTSDTFNWAVSTIKGIMQRTNNN